MEYTIDIGDVKTIKQPPSHLPMALVDEDCKVLAKLQAQGVICPSISPWASPILLVKKKDGRYQMLNAMTQNNAYLVPRAQNYLDMMAGSKMFSTTAILSTYNKVQMAERDIPKTAFTTKYGLFGFTIMPFGLMRAPADRTGIVWPAMVILSNLSEQHHNVLQRFQ